MTLGGLRLWWEGLEGTEDSRRAVLLPTLALLMMMGLALALVGGCTSAAHAGPYRTEVVYALPDPFVLAMRRFERKLEGNDVDGLLRCFDPVSYPAYRDWERNFLSFARRSNELQWSWRIRDIHERGEYRELEVEWKLTFLDVLHAHKAHRRGVSLFQWSRTAVPRLIGLAGDQLFPDPHRGARR